MENKQIPTNLYKFFLRVNKLRTKLKKAENPSDSFEEFLDTDTLEDVIRKGMSQYDDLISTIKRLKTKNSNILTQMKSGNSNTVSYNQPQMPNYPEKKVIKKQVVKQPEPQPQKISKPQYQQENNYKQNYEEVKYKEPARKVIKKKPEQDYYSNQNQNSNDYYSNNTSNNYQSYENLETEEDSSSNKLPNLESKITPQIRSELSPCEYEFWELDIKKGPKIKLIWKYIYAKSPNDEEKIYFKVFLYSPGRHALHWGVLYSATGLEWHKPPPGSYPPNTHDDKQGVQTDWVGDGNERWFEFTLPRGKDKNNYVSGILFSSGGNSNFQRHYWLRFRTKYPQKNAVLTEVRPGLKVPNYILDAIKCEATYHSWTLMHRYEKCLEIIDSYGLGMDNPTWIWILIWLRYSSLRQLAWQRNYNTRPALLGQALARLSDELITIYKESLQKEKPYKKLIESKSSIMRTMLSFLGKGTGNGQEIRDEILKILERNHMHGCFYEEWHQKLHNNSTPEDITICEALINFLKARGDMNVYWKTLHEGGITKERLASYERAIRHEPEYRADLSIPDFENYLRILKSVHASTDLVLTYESCKWWIGKTCCRKMEEIIREKDNKDPNSVIPQIKRVSEVREILQQVIIFFLNINTILKEILFLELSLEVYVRQLVEKIIHIQLDYRAYIEETSLILRNIKISFPNFQEFNLCYDDWINIVEKLMNDQSREAALKVKSVISRLNRVLSSVIDYYNFYYDEKAKYFGTECKCDKFSVDLFSEEMIRGTIFFALSMLLKKIDPIIRKKANLGDWLIISRGSENVVSGKLLHVPNLHDVQFKKYNENSVLVCENVSGDEEVPDGCVCLMIIKSENYPDVLAHVSVRARNLNVPFVVCFSEDKANNILKYINQSVDVTLENQEVKVNESHGMRQSKNNYNDNNNNQTINLVDSGDEYKKIFLELSEFDENSVGAKSKNTKKVYSRVPNCDWLRYPESFAIPFNVEEYFLTLGGNKDIGDEMYDLINQIESNSQSSENITKMLQKCKDLTMKINFIENSETLKLKNRIIKFGVNPKDFLKAFKAIKSVWASKFNERVYLAVSKVGISLTDIKMSVLCQKIIPAEYAYVIHTKNPTNNNSNEVFAEVVSGMGETLVGAYEGQSFSFSYNKKTGNYEIQSFPNKGISLRNSGFIFRSDSNTEDLEGFSGAGLFDSVPMVKDKQVAMTYYNDRLFKDRGFVDNLIKKISQLGINVEKMFKIPQDIEGVFYNGQFYIVQTRPQV